MKTFLFALALFSTSTLFGQCQFAMFGDEFTDQKVPGIACGTNYTDALAIYFFPDDKGYSIAFLERTCSDGDATFAFTKGGNVTKRWETNYYSTASTSLVPVTGNEWEELVDYFWNSDKVAVQLDSNNQYCSVEVLRISLAGFQKAYTEYTTRFN